MTVATHPSSTPRRSRGAVLFLSIVALGLSACGSGSSSVVGAKSSSKSVHASGSTGTGGTVTRGSGVPASAVTVIKGWSDSLRDGQLKHAAAYWAKPSVMINGPDAAGRFTLIHIHSTRDAQIADATLSCGATLRHASRNGRYVRADFTLSPRVGAGAAASGCSGPASVDFLIHGDHISRWLRAAPAASSPPQGGEPAGQSAAV